MEMVETHARFVMGGLVPAMNDFISGGTQDVDAGDGRGHDDAR
jgi:hypothetical protein